MARQRVVDSVGRRIRLVHADIQILSLEALNQDIGKAAVLVEEHTHLPWPRDAAIDAREAVHADDDRDMKLLLAQRVAVAEEGSR